MDTHSKKILRGPLRACIGLLIIGILFKIQHWPGAIVIIVSAIGTIGVLYIFRFLKKDPKVFLDYVKLVLIMFWAAAEILHTLHLPNPLFLNVVLLGAVLTWLVLEGFSYFTPEEEKKKLTGLQLLMNTMFALAVTLTLTGAIFNVQHWPYASLMLISGLGFGALWFVLGLIIKTKEP